MARIVSAPAGPLRVNSDTFKDRASKAGSWMNIVARYARPPPGGVPKTGDDHSSERISRLKRQEIQNIKRRRPDVFVHLDGCIRVDRPAAKQTAPRLRPPRMCAPAEAFPPWHFPEKHLRWMRSLAHRRQITCCQTTQGCCQCFHRRNRPVTRQSQRRWHFGQCIGEP